MTTATASRSTSPSATASSTRSTAEPRSSSAARSTSCSPLATCWPSSSAETHPAASRRGPVGRTGPFAVPGAYGASSLSGGLASAPTPVDPSRRLEVMTEPRPDTEDVQLTGTEPREGSLQGRSASRAGFFAAVGAYLIWAFLPLYFLLLQPAGPFEIVAWRIVFSLVLCAILVAVTKSWHRVLAVARRPRLAWTLAAAAVFVFINWLVYVLAALAGQVVEASLGYFINPIVSVLLGVLVLKERLRPLQWVAIGISVLAVLVLAVGHGTFPWIAVALALSFGLYGLLKKRLGPDVDALTGLTLETAWLFVPAVGILVALGLGGALVFGSAGPANVVLLIAA